MQKQGAAWTQHSLDISFLVAAVALTRIGFRSHLLYDLDSVNFALGMQHFDPTVHQPHPPGYFLYICLARLVNAIFRNENNALVAISVVASCGAAVMIYALALRWFGARAARFAGLIFLFSPLAWFHGTVALTYIVEAFFSALLGYLCWRVYSGESKLWFAAALVTAIGAGIRPTSLLFLLPLFLFSLSPLRWKDRLKAVSVLVATLLCWSVPMAYEAGGPLVYLSSLGWLSRHVAARQTVFNSAFTTSVARFCGIVAIYVFCFGSLTLIVPRAFHLKALIPRGIKLFTLVWITPALLFFTFVFLRLVNSGYLLVIFPPACIWLALWSSDWFGEGSWPRPLKLGAAMILPVLNVIVFLAAPAYWSYRSIRQFELELADVQKQVRHIASPETTLLVGFDSHFLGFRHAGYYLPDYTTAEFPHISLPQGKRIFVMHQRATRLSAELDVSAFENFVIFPLPADGQEYQAYLKQVQARLPSTHLAVTHLGSHTFVSGPIEDLRFLFPGEVHFLPPVYTVHHSLAASVNIR